MLGLSCLSIFGLFHGPCLDLSHYWVSCSIWIPVRSYNWLHLTYACDVCCHISQHFMPWHRPLQVHYLLCGVLLSWTPGITRHWVLMEADTGCLCLHSLLFHSGLTTCTGIAHWMQCVMYCDAPSFFFFFSHPFMCILRYRTPCGTSFTMYSTWLFHLIWLPVACMHHYFHALNHHCITREGGVCEHG